MAILTVATLRSPFLPQAYATFPPLWLLTLMAARREPTLRTIVLVLATWALLDVYVPLDAGLSPRGLALLMLLPQLAMTVLAVAALRAPKGSSRTSP
jgi:hypothetical protein